MGQHCILINCNQKKLYDFSEIFDSYLEYDFVPGACFSSNKKFSVKRYLDTTILSRSDLEKMIYNKDNLILYRKNGIYLLIENYNNKAFRPIDDIMKGI